MTNLVSNTVSFLNCHQLISVVLCPTGQAHMAHFTHLSGLRSGTHQPRDIEKPCIEYANIFDSMAKYVTNHFRRASLELRFLGRKFLGVC